MSELVEEALTSEDPARLVELAVAEDADVREAVYRNPHRPLEWVHLLERAGVYAQDRWSAGETFNDWNGAVVGGAPPTLERKGVPLDPDLPFADLERLRAYGPFLRIVVARHPATPPPVLVELTADPSRLVRQALVHLDRLPREGLRRLAEDADEQVRAEVAGSPRAPPELVQRLLSDPADHVRGVAVRRPDLDPQELVGRVEDRSHFVRWIVAQRVSDLASLARLSRDEDRDVRKAVAESPHATPEILGALEADALVDSAVARHARTPPDALARLAASPDWMVRESVARHPSTPTASLRALAADPLPRIRGLVAHHPATPAEVRARLAQDPDPKVRAAALG